MHGARGMEQGETAKGQRGKGEKTKRNEAHPATVQVCKLEIEYEKMPTLTSL